MTNRLIEFFEYAILIVSVIVFIFALTVACGMARAADVIVNLGENITTKSAQLQNGDTLKIADGKFDGTITLKNKSNITIAAANVGTISIATRNAGTAEQTPWATGPKVTIDAKGAGYTINLEGCNDITIRGLLVTGARDHGIRFVNSNRITVEDTIGERNGDSGLRGQQSPEDHSKRTNPRGHKLTRFVTQGNGAHGFGMSFNSDVTCVNTGSFFNNRGWHENLWGSESKFINGKWYAHVQNSGGGGKWLGCDSVTFLRHWTAANNGYGLWFDWIDSNCVVRHSLFDNQWWNQHDYDNAGIHIEICDGPNLIEDCLFRGSTNIASQDSESHGTTFRNNLFERGWISHRNQENRNDGIRNLTYEGNKLKDAKFNWGWSGIKTEAERASRNIRLINNQTVATLPAWDLGWGGGGVDPDPPDPDPTAAPQPTDGGEFVTAVPTGSTNGWGPIELNRSNGEKAAGDGKVITLGGKTYDKGLGTHALANIPLALGGRIKAVRFVAGIDGEATSGGSSTVQVWNGATKLYESPLLKGGQAPVAVDVGVAGLASVTITVTDGGNGVNSDHVSLGFLRLIPDSSPPPPPPPSERIVPSDKGPIRVPALPNGEPDFSRATTKPAN